MLYEIGSMLQLRPSGHVVTNHVIFHLTVITNGTRISSNFLPLSAFFSQICRLCDRELLTTRDGQFNPEGAGLPCACGSYWCGAVDIEDLPY